MSLRKMLNVSLLMLLAMILAATSAHARFDLFGQLLTSKNQPNPNSAEKLHKKLDFVSKPVAISQEGWLPYPECIEKCDECVVCTRIYPIELAYCYCGKNTTSNPKKPAIQNSGEVEESHKKLDFVSKPVAISQEGWLPYPECIEKCDECVVCTRIYPIELAYCYCGKNTTSNSKKPAIQNSGEVEESHKKLDFVSKPVAISQGGWLPYPECIEKCDECTICSLIYPIEKALCYCGKKTEFNSKKPAIQNSGEVEESHRKLNLVSKTVAISEEGFLPYPECIEKCDECVICTLIYPIEKALCYCGKNTASNSKKPAVQNSGDDKKLVLRTEAKLDPVTYEDCSKTCEVCACTLPLPPASQVCICASSKAGRRQSRPNLAS